MGMRTIPDYFSNMQTGGDKGLLPTFMAVPSHIFSSFFQSVNGYINGNANREVITAPFLMAGMAMSLKCPVCAAEDRADSGR
jgi:hypothetical protein